MCLQPTNQHAAFTNMHSKTLTIILIFTTGFFLLSFLKVIAVRKFICLQNTDLFVTNADFTICTNCYK